MPYAQCTHIILANVTKFIFVLTQYVEIDMSNEHIKTYGIVKLYVESRKMLTAFLL